MVKAAIFDWYGTLAEWANPGQSNYEAVLAQLGYPPAARIVDEYFARFDGVEHVEHSHSRDAYLAWTRLRLAELAGDCGVAEADAGRIVEALIASDEVSPMVPYPDGIRALRALREEGVVVAVCSNWGWDLELHLEATGVAPLVDVAVTSAQAGYRKPHRGIYEHTLGLLGIAAGDALFVGDSWAPDVIGPTAMGMRAVHVLRDRTRPAPELPPGVLRVGALDELLAGL